MFDYFRVDGDYFVRQLKLRLRLGSCLRRSDGTGILQRSQAVWKRVSDGLCAMRTITLR